MRREKGGIIDNLRYKSVGVNNHSPKPINNHSLSAMDCGFHPPPLFLRGKILLNYLEKISARPFQVSYFDAGFIKRAVSAWAVNPNF
jgi:hypothetical protein